MNEIVSMLTSATGLLAIGIWVMLATASPRGRWLGALLVVISLGLVASQLPGLGRWASDGVFYILAAVTVLAAVATVTFRNPVYSAIWFGLSLLGTAGLFLFQGAQFLGVATVVVYAGAILVTFLFVLMLAQPRGQAYYDRTSWAAALSAFTGALVVGVLTLAVVGVFQNPTVEERPEALYPAAVLRQDILADEHMAHLGGRLFGSYLVAVEVAGTLLLVALVGTVAIVAQIHAPGGGRSHE